MSRASSNTDTDDPNPQPLQELKTTELADEMKELQKDTEDGNPEDKMEDNNPEDKMVSTSVEKEFEKKEKVLPWTKQITLRAMVTSFFLNLIFVVIVTKLNLTTGVIPSLNVAAGLLGYGAIRMYTSMIEKLGLLKQPFTRQENTVIQTCVVACSGIAFSTGSGSYILGMSPLVAAQAGSGNTPANVKKLALGWMIGYNFLVSFVGLFSIILLRKTMILKYKLTYPSGTATATLINSFHTSKGGQLAKKQVKKLFQFSSFSFLWALFQWFFAAGDNCGFSNFPTFGLKAFSERFYFDFSSTYVGVGMICPYMVNISLMLGAIISWGIMWPMIESKKGVWYRADLPDNSLFGIQGYRVFIAIATMLGDGLFHVIYMLTLTFISCCTKRGNDDDDDGDKSKEAVGRRYDEKRRKHFFLKDQIHPGIAIAGYVTLAAVSTFVVPLIFHQIKWYHLVLSYVIAPILGFCNAYGCGLSDWSLASNYGKIMILIVSAWVGLEKGGIVAGLVACGVMMNIVSTASDLMQDFKTGYLTLSSPRAMLASQLIGTAMGCVFSPVIFWFFYKAYKVGDRDGKYPAPFAAMYRGISILGTEGLSSLPKNCLAIAGACFAVAFLVNLIREGLKRYEKKWRVYRFVPSPMCMAIPFYLGGYFAIDMMIGSIIVFVWEKTNKKGKDDYKDSVASGLICGDSLWGIPAAALAFFGVNAPICMRFLTAKQNAKVTGFI